MVVHNPFSMISIYIFGGLFNLSFSIMMFYLRSKGGAESHTKSQLWGLTILAWLFLLNTICNFTEVCGMLLRNAGWSVEHQWPFSALWSVLTLFTGYLLLAFGLVYPRPVMNWDRLRFLIFGVMSLGLIAVAAAAWGGHIIGGTYYGIHVIELTYIFAIFIPVFIWLGQYSRAPSNESRMMYTIFIWGFLFVVITKSLKDIVYLSYYSYPFLYGLTINMVLLFLAIVRLLVAMWAQRGRWSTPEWIHVSLLLIAIGISTIFGWLNLDILTNPIWKDPGQVLLYIWFMTNAFGWMMVRPVLFSYGLLRYRLLGTNVKAESALAKLSGFLVASAVGLIIINALGADENSPLVAGAIVITFVLVIPFWRMSERFVTRLLPMSAGAKGVSMKERRNTYFMALQTAVVKGQITDEEDGASLKVLRRALKVTDREHDLLLESIALHEARRAPKREVMEAYLIFRDGRLLAHHIPTETDTTAEAAGKDSDIVAGMFAAISEYVKEAMKRGKGRKASMDTISYGASSLVIESENNVVLAILLDGIDDLMLRQSMRDALAEVNERYGKVFADGWDGDMTDMDDLDGYLKALVSRVGRWEK